MAIRMFPVDKTNNLRVNVLTEDNYYSDCDIPENPYAAEGFFSFWRGDKLATIPIVKIKYVEFYVEFYA